VPTPEFASHLSDLEERLKHLEASRLARSRDSSVSLASRLMPIATPVGMLITLFAAGTLLHHRPPRGAWRLKAGDGERVRAASLWIVAIAALSLFDLACTVAASAAGGFLEMNPVARMFMTNPWHLAVFKTTTTTVAILILWSLRRYVGAQVASWYLCLLLSLLAVRWVAVQSLFYT